MHFVVHWELIQKPLNAEAIQKELRAVLQPYSWARPLTNFYVVHVPSTDQHQKISASLIAIATKYPNVVHVIMSPLMTGGIYTGRIQASMWSEINSRTQ